MSKSIVSDKLVALRERAGLTKTDMAKRLGMSYSTYTHYEYRFKEPYLPVPVAEKIATALSGTGISRAEVMDLAGITEPQRVENGVMAPASTKLVPVYDVASSAGPGAMVGYESIAYSRISFRVSPRLDFASVIVGVSICLQPSGLPAGPFVRKRQNPIGMIKDTACRAANAWHDRPPPPSGYLGKLRQWAQTCSMQPNRRRV